MMNNLIGTAEIAAMLGVTRQCANRLIARTPNFPSERAPRKWELSDFQQWIGREVQPGGAVNKLRAPPTVRSALLKKLEGARRRSRLKQRPCLVTLAHLLDLYERQAGRCAVSGIAFVIAGGDDGPFAPTIDRKDSASGYTVENVRLVCLSVNLMMNKWGDAAFYAVVAAMQKP